MNRKTVIFNLLIVFAMVIWGGTWVSAKAISNIAEPMVLTFIRFFFSVIFFIPVIFVSKTSLKLEKDKVKFLIFGSFSMAIYFLLFFKGLQRGYANMGGVLVTSLIPIYTLLINKILFKRKFAPVDYIGVLIGLSGGMIIIRFWDINVENLFKTGNIYFIICPVLWSLVTVSSEKMGRESSSIAFGFYSHLVSAMLFLFFLDLNVLKGLPLNLFFWGNIFYLSVISSVLATTLYFYSTSKINSFRTSVFTFIVPASSLLLSMIFLSEKPEVTTLIGGTLSVFATILINYGGFKRAESLIDKY
ncbi:MAG: DMT family transporter [Proteobacteria bacterium]|nr:DMT family transporter [Pseudomonadota bacterium]